MICTTKKQKELNIHLLIDDLKRYENIILFGYSLSASQIKHFSNLTSIQKIFLISALFDKNSFHPVFRYICKIYLTKR